MRWQDRMKTAEDAAELGVAEGTVHAHLHTARGKLIAGLQRYYPFGRDGDGGNPSSPAGTSTTQNQLDLFVADFDPQFGEHLAERHAGGYDTVRGPARYLAWLSEHADSAEDHPDD